MQFESFVMEKVKNEILSLHSTENAVTDVHQRTSNILCEEESIATSKTILDEISVNQRKQKNLKDQSLQGGTKRMHGLTSRWFITFLLQLPKFIKMSKTFTRFCMVITLRF